MLIITWRALLLQAAGGIFEVACRYWGVVAAEEVAAGCRAQLPLHCRRLTRIANDREGR
jgi:hypothetical protein